MNIGYIYNLFSSRFLNRTDVFYQWERGGSQYWCKRRALTEKDIELHITGAATIALPALSQTSTCKWLAFDIDDNTGKGEAIKELLKGLGWSVFQDSKRDEKEGHVMMLLDNPVPAASVRRFAIEVLNRLGLKERADVEVFPAQDRLKDGGVGNGLRMPLGLNQKPVEKGGQGWGWIDGVEEQLEEQVRFLEDCPLNSAERLILVADGLFQADRSKQNTFDPTKYRRPSRRQENILQGIAKDSLTACRNGFTTQCPICRAEGHDTKGNNLWISGDGRYMRCAYNNGVHASWQIREALRK